MTKISVSKFMEDKDISGKTNWRSKKINRKKKSKKKIYQSLITNLSYLEKTIYEYNNSLIYYW
jgi:hypothetical protein